MQIQLWHLDRKKKYVHIQFEECNNLIEKPARSYVYKLGQKKHEQIWDILIRNLASNWGKDAEQVGLS